MAIAIAFLVTLVVTAALLGHRRLGSFNPIWRRWFLGALAVVACAGGLYLLRGEIKGMLHPPEYDFLIFWINGQIAAQRLNYYDSALATTLAQPFQVSADFARGALARPFLYSPPTILFFLPLGWLGFHPAAGVWFGLQFVCLMVSAVMLARTFLKDSTVPALLITSLLLVAIGGTRANVATGQTLFLLLLTSVLFFRWRNGFVGGVCLGLCILLKPLAALFLLYAALRRKWRACFAALAVLATSALVTLGIFGSSVFSSYLSGVTNGTLPQSMYTEFENQSLSAWMFRWFGYSHGTSVAFVVVAVVLVCVTCYRIVRMPAELDAESFSLVITLALLVYPASLISYSTLLIVPMLVLSKRASSWPIVLACYLLNLGGRQFIYTGFASALLWLVFISMGLGARMGGLAPRQPVADLTHKG